MIPYSDLVAALRHWRARNGMPVVGDDVGPPPSSMVMAPPGPTSGSFAATPKPKPPAAPFPPARPDEDDEIEAEVLSEEMYESDGADFAMSFDGAPAPTPAPPRENTQVGPPPVGSSVSFGYGEPSQTQPEPTREPSRTDPSPFPGAADDDFEAEIAASIDARHEADSIDETLVADDPAVAAAPTPKGKGKGRGKKR
jgi:hypothetical protein